MAVAILPASASAEVLFTETFDYPAGTLVGQGGWVQSNHKEDPIQVTTTTLNSDIFLSGNSIKLGSTSATAQDVARACVPVANDGIVTPLTSGDVYIATLINVQKVESEKYFFSCVSTNYSKKLGDAAFTGDYNRVFAVPSENEGKFSIGFGKSTTTPTMTSGELDLNTTYLLVLHVGVNEGTNNDVYEAWINPTSAKPSSAMFTMTSGSDMTNGFVGVAVHQTTNFSTNCPEMLVGPIKVATTWDELFDGSGSGGEEPGPGTDPAVGGKLTASLGTNLSEIALYQYQSYPLTLTVKGENLTDDVTVGGLGSDIKASTTTISAADAMSADGYKLTLTVTPGSGEPIKETVTLTSGSATAEVPVDINVVVPVNELMNFRFAASTTPWDIYYYNGSATVTYVDDKAETPAFYLEDIVGGIKVYYTDDEAPFKAGDKISKFYLQASDPELGVNPFYASAYFTPEGYGYGTLVAENQTKTPTEATLDDIKKYPEDYINRLVTVSDVTFANAGATFSTASTTVTSGSAEGKVRAFNGSDIIGTTIPESAGTVTGISTSMNDAVITVRYAADITAAPEAPAEIEIEREILIDATEYYPLGVDVPFATLTVKATSMSKPTAIWFGGKQRNSFKADLEEIPAGTGTYTVNITFCPTVVGRNEAMINFDATPTELSQSLSVSALGFDPDNMPEFTVTPAELEEFSAAVGATHEQTLTISAKNLLDYGNVRVLGQGQGAFILGSTTFLKSGETQLKVTFTPKSEGSFSETIEFSTPKAQTVTITVSGKTSGAKPGEDKQGDELTFDVSDPKAQYATDFNGCGLNNTPLSLEGWKNVAVDGTRAFWAYTKDDNTMAKVTAYDSMAGVDDEAPAEMLLLSPALDYANSPSRLLEFRLMGEMMTDNMDDRLSVLYIDPTLDEYERYQVIQGIDIPVGADNNGAWRSFVIDLDGMDIADTFFIGFHYLSTRGRNTSTVYYVDDFAWGSTSTPFIRVDKTVATGSGLVGTTSKIADFTVTGLNLNDKITLGFNGADKANFSLSTEELPAEGGTFAVNYTPAEEGDHAVYVTLDSTGAPTTVITVGGTATTSGIDSIGTDNGTETIYYNLRGERIYRPQPGQVTIKVVNGVATKIATLR